MPCCAFLIAILSFKVEVETGSWTNSTTIAYTIPNLVPAEYNLTIVVTDVYGHTTFDTIYLGLTGALDPVTITTTATATTTTTTTTTISGSQDTTTISGSQDTTTVTETSPGKGVTVTRAPATETITKTAEGFGLVLLGLSFVAFVISRRKK